MSLTRLSPAIMAAATTRSWGAAAALVPLTAPVFLGSSSANNGTTATHQFTSAAAVPAGQHILAVAFTSNTSSTYTGITDDTAGGLNSYATVIGTDHSGTTNSSIRVRARLCQVTTPLTTSSVITTTYGGSLGGRVTGCWAIPNLVSSPIDTSTNNTVASGNPSFSSPALAQDRNYALGVVVSFGGSGDTQTDTPWGTATLSGANGGTNTRVRLAWLETSSANLAGVTYSPVLAGGSNTHEVLSRIIILKVA